MSDFASNEPNIPDNSGSVDFSKARKLERSGSTCDCYETHLQRRHVFIKRLKEEYRHAPKYLVAFDKEYDTGITLDHPCLPTYREFHGDYIVMDYIDGTTLADMIANKDPWLMKESNLKKLIGDLIDVVDYLHKRNVVHCDIKPDNVMIKHDMRTLKLIDLDKAYTDWSEKTSGSPENYGLGSDAVGNADLDFRGIGLIIDRLMEAGYRQAYMFAKISKLCKKPRVTPDELHKKLSQIRELAWGKFLRGAFIILSVGAILALSGIMNRQHVHEEAMPDNPVKDTIVVKHTEPAVQENITPPKTHYEKNINMEMAALTSPMKLRLEEAESLVADTTVTIEILRETLFDLNDTRNALTQEAYNIFKERYPDVGETDIEMAVVNSPAFREMNRQHTDISQKIADRIEQIYDNQ